MLAAIIFFWISQVTQSSSTLLAPIPTGKRQQYATNGVAIDLEVNPISKQISLHSAQLFEIEPSEKPYQELAKTLALDIGNSTRRVEDLFAMGKYPEVDMLVLGEVILLEGIMPLNGRCFEGHRRMLPGYL